MLTVTEQLGEVMTRLTRAADGEPISANTEQGQVSVTGWAIFSPQASGEQVYVLPGSVAYVRDAPQHDSAQWSGA